MPMTEEVKTRRRLARKAAKTNAKLAADHPLFVSQLAAEGAFTTEDAEYWRWRKQKAGGTYDGKWKTEYRFGNPAVNGLAWIEVQAIERLAFRLLGPVAGKLAEYIRRTYPMPDFGRAMWIERLTTVKVTPFAYDRTEVAGRITLTVTDSFPPTDWMPLITREQFDVAIPKFDSEPAVVDDGGLAKLLDAALSRRKTPCVS